MNSMKKISENQQAVLDLVANSLFSSTQSHEYAPESLAAILQEASEQTVLLLAASELDKLGCDLTPYQNTIRLLHAHNISVAYEHYEVDELLGTIPYVIMKGLVSASYYPKPELRILGDVDFYVEDVDAASKSLEANDFVWNGHVEHKAHKAYHREPDSEWELHWSLSGVPSGKSGDTIRSVLSTSLSTARVVRSEYGKYYAPDDFHHCMIMLTHTAGHLTHTGIGLRHLCDWAVFANQIDVARWENELKACGLWRFAQILTQLSIVHLRMPEQQWAMERVDDALLDELIADIFSGGNFGRKDSQRINQAKLMTDDESGAVDGKNMLAQLFFSVNKKAKDAMPICKQIKVLLPIAWCYVCIRHMIRIATGKRPKINMNAMISGAAERREIYKQFHLFETQ